MLVAKFYGLCISKRNNPQFFNYYFFQCGSHAMPLAFAYLAHPAIGRIYLLLAFNSLLF